eukprot:8294131-Alexandrium_andersonii.AAC.1
MGAARASCHLLAGDACHLVTFQPALAGTSLIGKPAHRAPPRLALLTTRRARWRCLLSSAWAQVR